MVTMESPGQSVEAGCGGGQGEDKDREG